MSEDMHSLIIRGKVSLLPHKAQYTVAIIPLD